jgi:hypothetical protein
MSMRASTLIGLIALISLGWLGFPSATPAPPAAKSDGKLEVDDRDEMANKLMERVTLKEPLKSMPLKDALDYFSTKHGITLLVDPRTFGSAPAAAAARADDEAVFFNQSINVPAMKNVRLGTLLKCVADQIDGVYLIYPDHIKLVGPARAATLTKPPLKAYMSEDENFQEAAENVIRSIPLITISFRGQPLEEALRIVELRSNRSIVLANQAADNGKTPITARFNNVPVDSVVATLAEMAGAKLARKGSVLLVTTAERADQFDPAPPSPPPADPSVEELKKRIGDLEKALEELKQKK